MFHSRSTFLALALLALASTGRAQQVTTPEAHLGRQVGADFTLADWSEVSSYFRKLAQESPRVQVETIGATTEGRDFLLAAIGSERNLARLDQLREYARVISDPRRATEAQIEQALNDGVPILFISIAMHSTETAAPQFGMEFAYELATSQAEPWRSARENLLVIMAPCLNPDGLDVVVEWYRKHVGTPQEGTGLTRLYQKYAGHDNNRDWFALTQNETRLVTEQLYSVWRPQVYWDVHQQGSSRERMFVPPFRDPLNPNLDPAIISAISTLGMRAVLDMTREGLSGISTGVSYDMWWNGGNRNVPVRHNMIGILTEAASVNVASPIWLPFRELGAPRGLGQYAPSHRFPWPWPGGWWHLRDIIDYELAFGRSLLASLAREPRTWLENALEAATRTAEVDELESPKAWVIPSDNVNVGAARRLVEILMLAGIEIHQSSRIVRADGRTYPAGSLVIRRDQPYSRHVKDLFEVQRYPEGEPPYDVAGWTLPLLFGVRRVEVVESYEADLALVNDADSAVASFGAGNGRALDSRDSDAWKRLFEGLAAGTSYTWGIEGDAAGSFATGKSGGDGESIYVREMPRVGLYGPWSTSMDEGWMRWVFDRFGVPYQRVRNEMIRAGRLGDFLDVLVIPSVGSRTLDRGRGPGTTPEPFERGLDPEGAVAIEEFVREGGTLITLGSSSPWAVELFDLPLADVTRGESAEGFSCPGSVLRTVPEVGPLMAGLPSSLAVFFSRSSAFQIDEDERKKSDDQRTLKVLLRYAPTRVLLSGYLKRPEIVAGQAAWVVAGHGDGHIHLFGFRPQYRGWSEAAFPLVFRALLLRPPLVIAEGE